MIVLRKINNKRYPFILEHNTVILFNKLLNRESFYSKKEKMQLADVKMYNLPIALIQKSIENKYNLLVTNLESFIFLKQYNQIDLSEIDKILSENIEKLRIHYN